MAKRQGRSDSGRSMLTSDEETSIPDQLEAERGMGPGLAPWPAQARLAAEEEFRKLNLFLMSCRSRFVEALRRAGPEAQHVANLAVTAGRDFLERELEIALAEIPSDNGDADPEIVAIKASLDAGQRYPAGDVLEERWKRLVRMSRTQPDESVQLIRQIFQSNSGSLQLVVERVLSGEDPRVSWVRVPKEARTTVSQFASCLRHRLSPRQTSNGVILSRV